jgi:hypothetical protein
MESHLLLQFMKREKKVKGNQAGVCKLKDNAWNFGNKERSTGWKPVPPGFCLLPKYFFPIKKGGPKPAFRFQEWESRAQGSLTDHWPLTTGP